MKRFAVVLLLLSAPWASAQAQDTDQDGVPDAIDGFPCDPAASGASYAPAQGLHGVMQFEDEWPYETDFDFNDVVIAYNFGLRHNSAGQTVALRASFDVLAIGGLLDNGLALHLPVPAASISAAVRVVGSGTAQPVTVRTTDAEAVLDLSSNLRELFSGQANQINSRTDLPAQSGATLEVNVTFSAPVNLSSGSAPFDLFIYRSADPDHEVHTSAYCGTARMDRTLFGQGLDASDLTRCFVDARGLPFALAIPEPAAYPREATDISSLYPSILDFASSGGTSSADFYRQPVASLAYPTVAPPRFSSGPDLPVDLSCNPVIGPVDQSAQIAAIVSSVQSSCTLTYPPNQCNAATVSRLEQGILQQFGRTQHSPLSCEVWTLQTRRTGCVLSSTTSVTGQYAINGETIGRKCTGPGCGVDNEIYAPIGLPVFEHPLDGLSLPIAPNFFYINGDNPLPTLVLDPGTGQIIYTPTRADLGSHRLKIAVLDIQEQVVELDILLHVVTLPPQPKGPVSRMLVEGAATAAQTAVVPDGPLAGKRLVFGASIDAPFVVEVRPIDPQSLTVPAEDAPVGTPYELTVVTSTPSLEVGYYDESLDGLGQGDFYQNVVEAPASREVVPAFVQSGAAQVDRNGTFGFSRNADVSVISQHSGPALSGENKAAGIASAVPNQRNVNYRLRPFGFTGIYFTHTFTGIGGVTITNRAKISLPGSALNGLVLITNAQLDSDPTLASVAALSGLTASERQRVLARFHFFNESINYLRRVEVQSASQWPSCFPSTAGQIRNGRVKVTLSNFLQGKEVAVYQLPLPFLQAMVPLLRDLLNPLAEAKMILSQPYGDALGLAGVAGLDKKTRHVLRHEYGHALQGMSLAAASRSILYFQPGNHDQWLLESTAEAFAMAMALPDDASSPGPQADFRVNDRPLGSYTGLHPLNPYQYGGFFNLMPMPVQGGGGRNYGFDPAAMCRMFVEKVPQFIHFTSYLAQYGGASDLAAWYADYRASLAFPSVRPIRGIDNVVDRLDTITIRSDRWLRFAGSEVAALPPLVLAPANPSPARVGVALVHLPAAAHRPIKMLGQAYDLGPITAQNFLQVSDRTLPLPPIVGRTPSAGGSLTIDTISSPPADDEVRAEAVFDLDVNGSLGLVVVNDLYTLPQTLVRLTQDGTTPVGQALFGDVADLKDPMGFEMFPVVRLTGTVLDAPGNPFSGQVRILATNLDDETETKRFLDRPLTANLDATGSFSIDDVPFNNFTSNKRELTLELTCPGGPFGAGGSERVKIQYLDQGTGPNLDVSPRLPTLRCGPGGIALPTDIGWTSSHRWETQGFVSCINVCTNAIPTLAECMSNLLSAASPPGSGEVLVSTAMVGVTRGCGGATTETRNFLQTWRLPSGQLIENAATCYSRTLCAPQP